MLYVLCSIFIISFWSSYEHLYNSIIRKTKIIENGESQNYNLNINESFVMLLTSKLITCLIDGFTSGLKPQSNAYLLIGSEPLRQGAEDAR